jgi:hypothetical protein
LILRALKAVRGEDALLRLEVAVVSAIWTVVIDRQEVISVFGTEHGIAQARELLWVRDETDLSLKVHPLRRVDGTSQAACSCLA